MFVLVMETSAAPATFTRSTNGNKSRRVVVVLSLL
jgi:hypothetical protein